MSPCCVFALPQERKEPIIDQPPVLNDDELMLIRAALRFWRDEMSPHDLRLLPDYFAGEEQQSLPESVGVTQLLERLENCRIRFVICDPDHEMVLHKQLFDSAANAKQNSANHVAIVTTLVPD